MWTGTFSSSAQWEVDRDVVLAVFLFEDLIMGILKNFLLSVRLENGK